MPLVPTSLVGPKPLMLVPFAICCTISNSKCRNSSVVAMMVEDSGGAAMMERDSGVATMMTEGCKIDVFTRGKSLSALTKLNRR